MAVIRYAIVDDDGLVLNVALWDQVTAWSPPTGTTAIPASDEVQIGGTIDRRTQEFTPGPILELPPDPGRSVEALIEVLESNGSLTSTEVETIRTRGRS